MKNRQELKGRERKNIERRGETRQKVTSDRDEKRKETKKKDMSRLLLLKIKRCRRGELTSVGEKRQERSKQARGEARREGRTRTA